MRHTRSLLTLAAATALALGGCAPDNTGPQEHAARPTFSAVSSLRSVATPTNSFLILGRGNRLPRDLATKVSQAGGSLTATIPVIGVAVATSTKSDFQAKASTLSGIEGVAQDLLVQWIDPNERAIEAQSIGDNETFFPGLQWAPQAIHAPEAWDRGARGTGVRVAILDGGLNDTHIDLVGRVDVARSASFVPEHPNFFDDVGTFSHATYVAGIVAAADNGVGTIGVAPGATIIGVKVLHGGGGSFASVIQGIVYASTPIGRGGAGANIINMSFGAEFERQGRDAALLASVLSRATTYAYQQGTTVIAAAGNSAIDLDHTNNLVSVPAQSVHVIAVAATGPVGFGVGATNFSRPASYTDFGQSAIHFAAPGGDFVYQPDTQLCSRPLFPSGSATAPCFVFDFIISPGGRKGVSNFTYSFAVGTSSAAPHVAGVAALIIEKNGGSMHPAHVAAALRRSADDLGKPGQDDFYGAGFVNALRAIR